MINLYILYEYVHVGVYIVLIIIRTIVLSFLLRISMDFSAEVFNSFWTANCSWTACSAEGKYSTCSSRFLKYSCNIIHNFHAL